MHTHTFSMAGSTYYFFMACMMALGIHMALNFTTMYADFANSHVLKWANFRPFDSAFPHLDQFRWICEEIKTAKAARLGGLLVRWFSENESWLIWVSEWGISVCTYAWLNLVGCGIPTFRFSKIFPKLWRSEDEVDILTCKGNWLVSRVKVVALLQGRIFQACC